MSATENRLMEVILLGQAMRQAQKRYFRTRNKADLADSKDLERQFDRGVEGVVAAPLDGIFQDDNSQHERN